MKISALFITALIFVSLCMSGHISTAEMIYVIKEGIAPTEQTASYARILRPMLALPLILPPGNTFQIIVNSDAGPGSNWSAALVCERGNFILPVVSTQILNDGNWSLNVSVPPSISPALYDLNVAVDEVVVTEPHAVSVEKFKSDFEFIQLTDTHIGQLDSDGSTYLEFADVIKELNLIHPDFIIITGDTCHKVAIATQDIPGYEQDRKLRERLLELEVPIFVLPGNHDHSYDVTTTIADFRKWINPWENFSFRYNNAFFASLDSGKYASVLNSNGIGFTDGQIAWLANELERNKDATLKFIFHHHPAVPRMIEQNVDRFLELIERYNVTSDIVGHTHDDEIWDGNRTKINEDGSIGIPKLPLYIQTRTTLAGSNNGYRLFRVSNGTLKSYTYDGDGNGLRDDTTSIPTKRLALNYSSKNDGTAAKLTATVTNSLREYFNDASIRFRLRALTTGNYVVTNGTLEQKIVLPEQNIELYHIRCNILPLSILNVSLIPPPLSVKVNTPNGGESYAGGQKTEISLNITGGVVPVSVRLEYSCSGTEGPWNTIIEKNYSSAIINYTWHVPFVDTKNGVVRVTVRDYAGRTSSDLSDNTFTIDRSAPSVQLFTPSTGCYWNASVQNISWKVTENYELGSNPVSIEYSTDDGYSWSTIVQSYPNTGYYLWLPPPAMPNSARCRIKLSVRDTAGNLGTNISPAFTFDTLPPSISVSEPAISVGGWRTLSCVVRDNFKVRNVTLHYRFNTSKYTELAMERKGAGAFYFAALQVIETLSYYFEAVDAAGNRNRSAEYRLMAVEGSIRGLVFKDTGEGIENVNVRIAEIGRNTSTDAAGRFEFTNISSGRYTLSFSKQNYQETSQSIELSAGECAVLNVKLRYEEAPEPTIPNWFLAELVALAVVAGITAAIVFRARKKT